MNNFEKLIVRYANGQTVCNCKNAYYKSGQGDRRICDNGCSANQIDAKEYIADCVVKEFLPQSYVGYGNKVHVDD